MTPLQMIEEWRKSCSCAPKGSPEECGACTAGLINAMEKSLRQDVLTLRDQLALGALPGLIAQYGDNSNGNPLWLTDKAYRVADAMLVSRKRNLA
jgi:hypothetical protein